MIFETRNASNECRTLIRTMVGEYVLVRTMFIDFDQWLAHETLVFESTSYGEIKDFEEYDNVQYKKFMEAVNGHKDLVRKWDAETRTLKEIRTKQTESSHQKHIF